MLRRKKKVTNDDGMMTIIEHVQELRRRLAISLLAIAVGTVLGYIWYGTTIGPFGSFGPIPSLGDILKEPYCSLPPEQRFGAADGECRLLATSPFEMFLLRLKVGGLAGIVLSAPVWINQIWGYITPGLHKHERRWALTVSSIATLLFLLGALLAYVVLAYGLNFLMTIGDNAQIAALNGKEYFGFAMNLLLIFGVSFEVPLLTVMLNFAGIVSYEQLKSKRRYVIVAMFIFAAVATPGSDPYSMVCLALALTLMMEVATQAARINDRRRRRKGLLLDENLDDEEASSIDAAAPIAPASSRLDDAAPVSSSALSVRSSGPVSSSGSIAASGSIASSGAVASSGTVASSGAVGASGPIVPTPAPQSSSAARPITGAAQPDYGRRSGLNLTEPQNSQQGDSFFDDVL